MLFRSILYFRRKLFYGTIALVVLLSVGYFLTSKILIVDEVMMRFDDLKSLTQTRMLDPSQNSFNWRLLYWEELLLKLKDSPVVGFGLGSVKTLGSAHIEAHNNYVQVFFEAGIGGIFYFAMIFMFLGRSLKGIYHKNSTVRAFSIGVLGVIIAYLINSLSGHLIRNAVYQMYFLSLPLIMIGLLKAFSVEEYKFQEKEMQ